VVTVISALLRKNDFLGRYGGEEFIFFFQNADQKTGIAIAERVRKAIVDHPVKIDAGETPISASFGVAMAPEQEDPGPNAGVDVLIRQADEALYQAKAAGRNRVVCFTGSEKRAV
jgi:diguanylate cyclase (GGDEF)-like protein